MKKFLAPWSNLDFDPKVMICYCCVITSMYFSNFVNHPAAHTHQSVWHHNVAKSITVFWFLRFVYQPETKKSYKY